MSIGDYVPVTSITVPVVVVVVPVVVVLTDCFLTILMGKWMSG